MEKFKEETGISIDRIPEEELVGDTQLVITTQFLGVEHGPTKTALDRAAALKSRYKNVFIINTAEGLTSVGLQGINYFIKYLANYHENLNSCEVVEWKGKKFGFFQCENNMPNVDTILLLLDTVKKLKPKVCVLIGGASIFAGLVNEMIPTLVVGLTQSNLEQTLCDYTVADKYQLELDSEVIKKIGYEDAIIEGKFTFSLKDQEEFITRSDLGINEDSFVISVVGSRLNEEISDEWWEQISKVKENIEILLIGGYSQLEKVINKYHNLNGKIKNLGFCKDAISRISLSDLYVNPIRRGGATSAVEALSVGVPVLSINYGDVAGTVGKDFYCEKIEDYPDLITKYCNDKEFYNIQRDKALQLADILLDSDSEFLRVVDIYLKKRKERYEGK